MSAPRIKDASFLQQHIEKLILAAGLLVLAIAVFLFVIGNPFAIELNRQTYDDPKDAVDVLVRTDEQIEAGLQDPNPLPPVITPKFQEDFLAMMNKPIDVSRAIAAIGDPGMTIKAMYPDIPEPSRYALVYPPAPKNVLFKVGTDVLDKEFDPAGAKVFFENWNKDWEEPGDFTMFVASGEFDIWQWISRLKADPETTGDIKIPAGIWAQRFGIAGVALLREEWDPERGVWFDRQIVVPLPDQVRVLPSDKAEAETTLALTKIATLRAGQLALAQPELPWLEGVAQVAPPGNNEVDGAGNFLQALDEENLGPAELKIKQYEEKIQDLEERRAAREQRGPRPGADRPGRGGGPDDFNEPRGNSTERRDPFARQIEDLRQRIERLRPDAERDAENRRKLQEAERRRDEERRRRQALLDARDRDLARPGDGGEGLAQIEGMNLQEGATLRVWAADPSMQPGKTYRYKLLVAVINPLYGVPRLAPDQLEENQHRAALLPTESEIDAMQWIGPIKVEPEHHFFFTGGSESKADIDIYRRYKGELRLQEFDGAPGDTIGGIMEIEDEFGDAEEIDMGVGAILVDIERSRDIFTNSTVLKMVYADEEGNIYERISELDKSSPIRKELRDEIQNGPEQALREAEEERNGGDFGPDGFGPGDS